MKKQNYTYYFSVEGETEKWYLEWLAKTINNLDAAKYKIKVYVKVDKNPIDYVKGLTVQSKAEIFHLCDRESKNKEHTKNFINTLDSMRRAEKLGKKIKYSLGYSNLTFELWMILHKTNCNMCFADRSQYLSPLNRAYGMQFESLDQYKEEQNFKYLLKDLKIEDVKRAISNARIIRKSNMENGYKEIEYKKYSYFEENPSTSLDIVIAAILEKCGL